MPVIPVHSNDALNNNNPGKQVLASIVSASAPANGVKIDLDGQVLVIGATAPGLTNLPPNTNVTHRRTGAAQAATLIPTTTPLANAQAVAVGANIVMTFSAPVSKGVGNLELFNVTTGTTIATVAVGSATVTVASNVVTYDPAANLPARSVIELRVDAGAFVLASDATVNSKRLVLRFTTA